MYTPIATTIIEIINVAIPFLTGFSHPSIRKKHNQQKHKSYYNKANNFVKILNKQKDFVEKETTSKLLKNTPSPQTGADDKVVTKEDFDKMTYSEMMNFMKESPELYKEYMK